MLFGLRGVAVGRVDSTVDGRVVHVVTADPEAARCPVCRTASTAVKGHVATRPKDLPYGEEPLRVVWHKRRWRCGVIGCVRVTFTEVIAEVPARARTTGRLRRAIGAAVKNGRSVSEAGAAQGVSWPTAQRATTAWAAARLVEPAPTRLLGIDETRFGRPRWLKGAADKWVRMEPWETGFVDLRPCGEGGQGLLGFTPRAAVRSGCRFDGRVVQHVSWCLHPPSPETGWVFFFTSLLAAGGSVPGSAAGSRGSPLAAVAATSACRRRRLAVLAVRRRCALARG